MTNLYSTLDNTLGDDSQRMTVTTLANTRRIMLERDRDAIGVSYRNTRLITAYEEGDIRLTMHGWYTLNSKEIMNSQLPPTIRVEFITPPGAHELHKYAHVYLAQPDGAWEGQVLLEGTARDGIVVTPTTNNAANGQIFYSFTQQGTDIKPLIEYNNRADDEIDVFLGNDIGLLTLNTPAEWDVLLDEVKAEYNRNHMMRGSDVLRMLDAHVLDAPVLLAAMRYDRAGYWRQALMDMFHDQNVREIRNSLRVFLHWFLLTGPVMMRRGDRPRPLRLDEWVTFDA